MKTLFNLFTDAAEFCRACNLRYVTIQRQGGDDSEYFLICNSMDQDDDEGECIKAYGAYSKAAEQKFFTFDVIPYKKWELSHLGFSPDDTGWEIAPEDLRRIKTLISEINARLSDYA